MAANTRYVPYEEQYTNPVTSVNVSNRMISGSVVNINFTERQKPSAKYDPHHADYVTGSASGSNTAGFDAYRQGISVVSDRIFYMGTTPRFGYHSDFLLEMVQEGEQVTFDSFKPFVDKANYENINAGAGLLSLIEGTSTTDDVTSTESPGVDVARNGPSVPVSEGGLSGIVFVGTSPFAAADTRVYTKVINQIEGDVDPGVKAEIIAGNKTNLGGSDLITNEYDTSPEIGENYAFEDEGEIFGGSVEDGVVKGGIKIPSSNGLSNKKNTNTKQPAASAYNEEKSAGNKYNTNELGNLPGDMKGVILGNKNGDTDGLVSSGKKVAGAGMTYGGIGRDSMAYGGLNRNA